LGHHGGALKTYGADNLHKLDADEISILAESEPHLGRVCDKKFSRNAVAKMLAYISFENKEFSSKVMNGLLSKIQMADFDSLRQHERPLTQMIGLEDENTTERLKKAISNLLEYLKNDGAHYKYCDSIVNLLHKIVKINPLAASIFAQYS
jgi:hypothetical protein